MNAGPDLTDLQPACCRHLIAKFGQSERAQRREGQERAEHEARRHMERFPTHPGWGEAGRRRSEPGFAGADRRLGRAGEAVEQRHLRQLPLRPAILEAFRAGALDQATVGSTSPIQISR
ncbi:hypothetical protein J2W99_003638 [Bosea robiniae]|nr:hypothetical protein [Bosea robiniae]